MFTTLKQKRIVYWGLGMMFIKKMNLRITSRSKNKLFFLKITWKRWFILLETNLTLWFYWLYFHTASHTSSNNPCFNNFWLNLKQCYYCNCIKMMKYQCCYMLKHTHRVRIHIKTYSLLQLWFPITKMHCRSFPLTVYKWSFLIKQAVTNMSLFT